MKTLLIITCSLCFSFQISAQWFPLTPDTESPIRTVHFIDENNGWIAGSNNFINKTQDGGETWTETGFHGSNTNNWSSIFAINSDQVYACGSTYTYDRWQTNYAFTLNGGNSWEFQLNWGSNYGSVAEVFFLNEDLGWKVGYNSPDGRLWRTTNGLSDWSYYSSLEHNPYSVYFIDENIGWISCADGFVLTTIDGGESWNEIETGRNEALKSIFFLNSSIGWAAGHNDEQGVIIKTSDGGETWHQANHPATRGLYSIQFVNEYVGWACGSKFENSEETGVILYTNDGGENWSVQHLLDKLSALYTLFFIDNKIGWAVGHDGLVLKTTNAGGTYYEGVGEAHLNSQTLKINPNPFTSSTTIEFELNHPVTVTITFYNQFGKQVDVIEERQQKGLNKVIWQPKYLSDGIYYFRLTAGEQIASGKVMLVR